MLHYLKTFWYLRKTSLFDRTYYSITYHVPRRLCVIYDALIGYKKENSPSLDFSAKDYYSHYDDVKKSGMNALYHYLRFGIIEGRKYWNVAPTEEFMESPYTAFFDSMWYRNQYMTPRDKIRAFDHYIQVGYRKRYLPFSNFDIDKFYYDNPDCNDEPLYYWYRKRIPQTYFKVQILPELYFTRDIQYKAMLHLYWVQQNYRINDFIPLNTPLYSILLFISPAIDSPNNEIMAFQQAYLEAKTKSSDQRPVIAMTQNGKPTYSGTTLFGKDIPIFRYYQVTYRFFSVEEVKITILDSYIIDFLNYLIFNPDDTILHIRKRYLNILLVNREYILPLGIKDKIEEYFSEVTYQESYWNSTEEIPFFNFFNAEWYKKKYMTNIESNKLSPADHYLLVGWRRQYLPFEYFDIKHFYSDNPKCNIEPLQYWFEKKLDTFYFTKTAIPQMHFTQKASQALERLYHIKQRKHIDIILPEDNRVNKVLLILVSPTDDISGGIMSFCGIYRLANELVEYHNRIVIAATIPGDITHSGFTMFDNDMPVFQYNQIVRRLRYINDILIMVPERYTEGYLNYLNNNPADPILYAEKRHLNIMDQNIDLMPEPIIIEKIRNYFAHVTQTTAHAKYCSIEKRKYYNIPTHLLHPPIKEKFPSLPYHKKENIFAYSYDNKPYKQKVLNMIAREFPFLKQVEINDMRYEEYWELIARAKWCITFGEGLDGYYSQPYEVGSISFAVWNDDYFTDTYQGLPTIFKNSSELLHRLPDLMRELDNESKYTCVSKLVKSVHHKEYFTDRTPKDQLIDFFISNYDIP